MKKIDLGQTISILANVGVIAGIVFLGFEIRQNTYAFYSQSRNAVLNSSQLELFELMRNPDIASNVLKSEQLTQDEQNKINYFLLAFMRVREYSWLQYQNGIIDREQWNTELVVIGVVLSTNRTRKWWGIIGSKQFNPNFSAFVDDYLKNVPVSNDTWTLQRTWDSQ